MKHNKIQIHKPLTRETLELTAPEGIEIISAKGVQTYNPITGRDHVDLDVHAVDRRPLASVDVRIDTSHLPEPRYEAGLPRETCSRPSNRCLLVEQKYVMGLIAEAQDEAIRSLNNAREWWEPRIVGLALSGTIDFDRETITVKEVVVVTD